MPSKDDVNDNDNENGNENRNDNETENENENDNDNDNMKKIYINDCLDKIIDKSKSFEDQIKLFKKVKNLSEYCFINDYGDKELKI